LLLVVGDTQKHKYNVMTIGWGSIGILWQKPVFSVLVRPTRYSYHFIEKNGEFTINVPDLSMKNEASFCGTKSGREFDKFKELGLNLKDSTKISIPYIDRCGLTYECRTIYKQKLDKKLIPHEVDKKLYPNKDYHTVYYGEILAVHKK
ncbi:MAG: flavin reductase family protein, partial [Armatimonadota bacterium]